MWARAWAFGLALLIAVKRSEQSFSGVTRIKIARRVDADAGPNKVVIYLQMVACFCMAMGKP